MKNKLVPFLEPGTSILPPLMKVWPFICVIYGGYRCVYSVLAMGSKRIIRVKSNVDMAFFVQNVLLYALHVQRYWVESGINMGISNAYK